MYQSEKEVTVIPHITATLTSDQVAFEKLMQDNGGCEFPCWWGLVLGKTSQDEWFRFLDNQPFRVYREDPLPSGTRVPLDYAYFSFRRSTATTYLHYEFQNRILSKVNIQIDRPDQWLSENVNSILLPGLLTRLKNLNQIPEIYVLLGSASTLDLPVLIVADDIGVMAEYTFNIYDTLPAPNDMNQWRYCLGFDQTTKIEITVQDPNISPIISTKERKLIEADKPPKWVRLEDWITPMNTSDFIQFFINNPDSCYVPSNLKPEVTKAS